MKHDEKERKKQGNLMKNRETMKNDEKERKNNATL